MAFKLLNGYDVEVASSKYVYENLIPAVQHINGKGCSDKWTLPEDIESVNQIDVIRVLHYAPYFRQLGAANNGSYHNQSNEGGYNNAPQSEHYSVPVDLYYDRGVPITSVQQYSNKIMLQQVVLPFVPVTVIIVLGLSIRPKKSGQIFIASLPGK